MSVHPCSHLPLPDGLGRSGVVVQGSNRAGGWARQRFGCHLAASTGDGLGSALLAAWPGASAAVARSQSPMSCAESSPGTGRAGEGPSDWESLSEQMGSWWCGFFIPDIEGLFSDFSQTEAGMLFHC